MDPQLDLQQLQGALALVQVHPEDHAALLKATMINDDGVLRALQGGRFVDQARLRPGGNGHWAVATFAAHSSPRSPDSSPSTMTTELTTGT